MEEARGNGPYADIDWTLSTGRRSYCRRWSAGIGLSRGCRRRLVRRRGRAHLPAESFGAAAEAGGSAASWG